MPNDTIKNLIFVDCEGHGPAPTLNDPVSFEFGAVFGPVWTTLFVLMGIAAFLVWKNGLDCKEVKIALGIFLGQLVLTRFGQLSFLVCTARAVRS